MKVSIVLLTFNEEKNLPRCLSSIAWCDDILIVDSFSSDKTLEIANNMGARVMSRAFDNFSNQRNFALSQGQLKNEWVLHLDADEVIPEEFSKELFGLTPDEGTDAYRVPSKLMFFGKWLRYAGMYPGYQVRLGHRERLRFKQVGHGQRGDVPFERTGTFEVPYLHYSFSRGMVQWFHKHVRYAKDEAQEIIKSGNSSNQSVKNSRLHFLKAIAYGVPVSSRPLFRFFYTFFWKRGFLDGRYGFLYALMLAIYEGMTAIFVLEEKLKQLSDHEM